jgi:hypothetical protein
VQPAELAKHLSGFCRETHSCLQCERDPDRRKKIAGVCEPPDMMEKEWIPEGAKHLSRQYLVPPLPGVILLSNEFRDRNYLNRWK